MPTDLPFMKFFPRDWTADDRLRLVGLAARGLWMDLLCLMHQSPERGYLLTALCGAVTPEQIARAVGASADDVRDLLRELEAAGVFSRDPRGVIFCRRMAREEEHRAKCAAAGKLGGNPALMGGVNPGDKGEVNPPVKGRAKGRGKGRAKGTDKGAGKGGDKATEVQSVRESEEGETPSPPFPADAGPGETDPPAKPARKAGKPNPLFDALADVTGLDPSTAGGVIGVAAKKLAEADPPYTPDEVRDFARRINDFCPWAGKDGRTRPTPGEVAKYIGLLRAPAVTPSPAARPPSGSIIPFPDRKAVQEQLVISQYLEAKRAMGDG